MGMKVALLDPWISEGWTENLLLSKKWYPDHFAMMQRDTASAG